MAERPRVLWLHTQPEHYFNCMMDELARGGDAEYIAAFALKGDDLYRETPVPKVAKSVFLKVRAGMEGRGPGAFGRYHADWRKDLLPLEYDVVIVSGYASRTQREVIADAHRRGIPVAMWSDSNLRSQRGRRWKMRLKRGVKKFFLRRIIRQVGWLLTTNSRGVAYWRYYGAPRGKIVLLPYYADYARIEAAKGLGREEVLGGVGLTGREKVLYTAARLVDVKGLNLGIKAFVGSGLAERGWVYLIAGVGPLEGVLKELAGREEGKSVRFLGFLQPRENLAVMAKAELFLLPSLYEPHGIVVGESMAAGTPVLASDVCGAAMDLVRRGVSGDLFRSGHWEDLREALVDLAEEGKLAEMRGGARRVFEEWFGKSSPIVVTRRVVGEMLASRGKRDG